MGDLAPRPTFGCFVDRLHKPTAASVRRALGEARTAWDDLRGYLADVHGLTESLHFMYGKRYGWALRLQRAGRLAVAMYPNRGYLTAQIILNRAQVALASAMTLPPNVARVFESATDHPEGRWLFIPVTSQEGVRELKPLIALKLSAPAQSLSPAGGGGTRPSNKQLHPTAVVGKMNGRG